MPPIIVFVFVVSLVLFGVVFIATGIHAHRQAQKRKRELAAWARSNGFRFTEDQDSKMDERYPGFSRLQTGHSRYAYNISRGVRAGRRICVFDYHYVTGGGKHQTTHNDSIVIVETGLLLKPLSIREENLFDRVGGFFGWDDIDFESAQFSARFCVKSPDKRWAYDVLHQETMEFLLASPSYNLEFGGSCVIAYDGSIFSPAQFGQALGLIEGVLDRIPKDVLRGEGA